MNQKSNPPVHSPFAVISDLHGDEKTFDAIMEQLGLGMFDKLFVLGNFLHGAKDPLEFWNKLQNEKIHCLMGPTEAALCALPDSKILSFMDTSKEKKSEGHAFLETKKQLGELVIERLRRLDEQIKIPLVDGSEVLLTYGRPGDYLNEIHADMDDETLLTSVDRIWADVYVCSGGHTMFKRQLEDRWVVGTGHTAKFCSKGQLAYTLIKPALTGTEVELRWEDF